MKFLCVECDMRMELDDRNVPGDGTFGASFKCPSCGRRIAMLANPMETELVEALGVEIGGSTIDGEPLSFVQSAMETKPGALESTARPRPEWSEDGAARLDRVPKFVRGMVKRIYTDWAIEHGVDRITPDVMDRARADLGLEDM
ncbi:MAG: PCP reductase family protein [Gemmatimonadales bacterium]